MIERTHYINGKNKFFASPYFIEDIKEKRNVKDLENKLIKLLEFTDDKSKGISKIRQWITELHKSSAKADLMMDRIKEVDSTFYNNLNLENERNAEPSILTDLIDLHTFDYFYKNNKQWK